MKGRWLKIFLLPLLLSVFCGGGVGRSSDNGFANGGSKLRPLALRKTGDSRLRKSQSKIARRANIKTTTRRQFIKFGFAGLVRKNKQYFRHQFSAVKKTIARFFGGDFSHAQSFGGLGRRWFSGYVRRTL